MDKALAHQTHTAEQIEQVATQTRRHKRRQASGIVHGKSRTQAGERLALDPADLRAFRVKIAFPPIPCGVLIERDMNPA